MGRRFKPSLEVRLDTTQPTREKGADSCTYIIEWYIASSKRWPLAGRS